MLNKNYTLKLTITAMCIALCVILPWAFHLIPNAGSIFSPMHIPVLICGLICGWPFGLFCGIVGPFFSSIITQMPPLAFLPSMMIELSVYGLCTGVLMKYVSCKKLYSKLYMSLIPSMIIGRIVAGIMNALIFRMGEYSLSLWISSYFITAWPAIFIQLVFIPPIIIALDKANLLPPDMLKK